VRCYYHSNVEAVGVCKSCQRGLCAACATDAPNGLACRGRCEARVAAIDALIERNLSSYRRTGLFLAFAGGLMMLVGLVTLRDGWPFVILGLAFASWGVFHIVGGRRMSGKHLAAKPSA